MQKEVAIIAAGQTPFTRRSSSSLGELCFGAWRDALRGSVVIGKSVDALVVCSAPEYDRQRSPAGVVAESLGLSGRPVFNVESLCSSGSSGLRTAYSLIRGGLHEVVAVVGFQKMSELSSAEVAERMGRSGDVMWESPFGLTQPAGFALFACAHMEAYGTSEADLAEVRVKSSLYAEQNEHAAYRKRFAAEDILASAPVVSPLKMLDCCANADGAAALIVASRAAAERLTTDPVWILGLGAASDSATLSNRDCFTSLTSARVAAEQAYRMAGVGPGDINVAEVHDCFTITEIIATEDLGFAPPGSGVRLLREGQTRLGGRIPVNVDGGLLGKGHPVGATGLSQLRTIVRQLRGECGATQVQGARIGLVHNLGGPGIYAFVTILGSDRP
ncbi:MAG: acetyl-CoA acetyltransferase [Burkholderiales bacterium]|nr:acetyl-CoA acetyltransferase [Burkholderiales bacterium]